MHFSEQSHIAEKAMGNSLCSTGVNATENIVQQYKPAPRIQCPCQCLEQRPKVR